MDYNFSDRLKNLEANAIREIFKLISQPDVISFAGGLPATKCIPNILIDEFANKLMKDKPSNEIFQYGATEGYMPLRQTLIEYVKKVNINNIDVENTLVISGGQQGIDLMFKAFVNKGDVVLVENPTYLAALHILKTYEGKAVGVDSEEDGLILSDLETKIKAHKPKLLYLVPNFSNPTGKTFSLKKRQAIYDMCNKNNIIIIEDDPYGRLRYDGNHVPSIKSLDKQGIVVYISSFSKLISPALRVGFAIADKTIIRKMTIGKQAVDVHTATLNQAIVNEFIKDDCLDKHIERCLPIYKEKKDCMINMLSKYMPKGFTFTKPDGGLFIWGVFDKSTGISAVKNFLSAVERKVAYVDGTSFFADGSGDNTLRLNFSNATLEQIEKGVKSLGEVFGK